MDNMEAKQEWCGSCNAKKSCRACYLPEMGGMEDWFCTACRNEIRSATKLILIK